MKSKTKSVLFYAPPSFCSSRVSPYSNPCQKISSGLNLKPQAPSPPFSGPTNLTRSFHAVSAAPRPGVGFRVGVARRILHPNPNPKYDNGLIFAGTRRFYHSNWNFDAEKIRSSMETSMESLARASRNWTLRGVIRSILVASSLSILIFCAGIERVPYSNKFHYTLSHNLENKYIENGFVKWCATDYIENERKLPPSDPRSIKMFKIKKRQINRRRRFIWKPFTKHLDGKVWEVYATDNYSNYESDEFEECLLNKVVIDAKMLRNLKSDEEYATVIAHEIGHIIARHHGENCLNSLFGIGYIVYLAFLFTIAFLLPLLFFAIVPPRYFYLLHPVLNLYDGPFYIFILRMYMTLPILGAVARFLDRRREAEADYIGLMLMASAGYDPEVAPHVYEKLLNKKNPIFFTSGKKRAKLLRKPKTMKLAKQVYEEVKAGYGVRNFA
ncbi:Peptidase M48 [Corchorus olitorius]|uniref:Peptidase M48 n=1 Tax=Corchorus olitorius TaxID=93759 RepID=A0A1R3K0D7_9ROSI|nr:Peptidase M48 [Corchorus olitorius]